MHEPRIDDVSEPEEQTLVAGAEQTPVRAVARAVAVLMALSGGPMRLGDVSVKVGLSKPTTHRILFSLKSMGMVVDFWAEPSYAQLLQAEQKRVHDYVVADKGTAQEALDSLVKDWKAIFKEEGKKF